MTAAAAPTPAKPFGMNGDQLAGSTAKAPAAMKNSTTATLIVTITLVTRALSLIPSTSKPVKASTIRVAGKLMSPPSYGALVSSARGRGPDQHEDARADDRTDAHRGQIKDGQRALELVWLGLAVGEDLLDGLGAERATHASRSPSRGAAGAAGGSDEGLEEGPVGAVALAGILRVPLH